MPKDIYGRQSQVVQDVWSVDSTQLTFGAGLKTGLLTQSMNWNYSQQISRLYEIGTAGTYLIAGRTQGQVSLQRIIGPNAMVVGFYNKFGDICNVKGSAGGAANVIEFTVNQDSCVANGQGSRLKYSLIYAIITSAGGSINAGDMILNEGVQLMYVSQEVVETAAGVLVAGNLLAA